MNARQRILNTLNHLPVDRVPLDIGATPVTGMHVGSVYLLRQALELDPPGTPVRVANIYQMLGEIKPDLVDALGIDVIGLERLTNSFGIPNTGWMEWQTFDGTPVLVPSAFNTQPEPNGDLLIYPQGDRSAPASGRMPKDGYYFDVIERAPKVEDDELDPQDNLKEFTPISEETLAYYRRQVESLRATTDKAIVANLGGTGFGDIAHVPGPTLKQPRGLRSVEEWYVSTLTRQEYIHQVFEGQCEIALDNLRRFHAAVGEEIDILFMSGTDFGGQQRPIISPRVYRTLFKPYQKRLNDWVHANTSWKVFMHTDGAVFDLIPDFIEAGFDILNPIQWTAAGMDPEKIVDRYGGQIAFWGAGVDTQGTLPFGSPADVRQEVARIMQVFKTTTGFVFSSVHNIQAKVPVENLLAFFEAYRQNCSAHARRHFKHKLRPGN